MKKILTIFMGVLIFIFTGCSAKVTDNDGIAKEYIKVEEYKIVESKGDILILMLM